ncbi:MAG: sigma-54-dependent Fis family transcriptional regulator [Deltaproteobacteria bacterium]|nr:sigma-54-dependent Fis family transcriptional regulator [Deltaproteobacteria bacterium]
MEKDLNILIIEADPAVSETLEKIVNGLGFTFTASSDLELPIEALEDLRPDIALLGPSLEGDLFHKCVHKLKIIDPTMPILTSHEEGMLLENQFAFEGIHYLTPKCDSQEISKAIADAIHHRTECEMLPELPVIIGQSPEIIKIREKIQQVAGKDITLLITGETGTGKELIARSVHYHSRRNRGPLVKINCGSLPDELLESEVFGFQKGAFTDAHRNKPGRIELAHGGTLFIDEIGDLSISLQVKFLQVLEDKAFSRLGGIHDKIIDTRVVAATNADLKKKVQEGAFRKDLFFRLNVVHMKAPPLRARKKDIPLLIHYFLNKYCFEFRKTLLKVPDRILDIFMIYHWPGNVRELENVIRRAIVVKNWDFVYKEIHLDNPLREVATLPEEDEYAPFPTWDKEKMRLFFEQGDFSLKKICGEYIAEAERDAILATLRETDWNRKKTAEMLKVSYKTLLNRIQEFGLKP